MVYIEIICTSLASSGCTLISQANRPKLHRHQVNVQRENSYPATLTMEMKVLFICTFYYIVCQIAYQIAPVFKKGPHWMLAARERVSKRAALTPWILDPPSAFTTGATANSTLDPGLKGRDKGQEFWHDFKEIIQLGRFSVELKDVGPSFRQSS